MWRGSQKSEQDVILQSLRGHRGGAPPPPLAGLSGLPAGGVSLLRPKVLKGVNLGMGWEENRNEQKLREIPEKRPSGHRDLQISLCD